MGRARSSTVVPNNAIMPSKKSIFRGPDAQHFQLVHRSQRDPLINDPEASQRVFKTIGRANDSGKKASGQTLAQLEASVKASAVPIRPNEGEAADYGIYYDDTSYDYMQHLRTVGETPEAFLIQSQPKRAPKGKTTKSGAEFDESQFLKKGILPEDVLPSTKEMTKEQAYAAQAAIPQSLTGLQPDMDPHLRQVLEALEDDAFVVEAGATSGKGKAVEQVSGEEGEDDDEDWMNELLGGGERAHEQDAEDWEFAEEGIEDDGRPSYVVDNGSASEEEEDPENPSWQSRFSAFKKSQQSMSGTQAQNQGPSSEDDFDASESGDTLASLPNISMSVIGGKKRRKGKNGEGSQASGYSMSSSSMFRNKGLSTLDEMFEKVSGGGDMTVSPSG